MRNGRHRSRVVGGVNRMRHARVRDEANFRSLSATAGSGAEIEFDLDSERPKTRGECRDGERPCPWVGCRHHLYLDINPSTGSIKLNFPEVDVLDLEHTCSLDVADEGGITLVIVGRLINVTRERARQLEVKGLRSLMSIAAFAAVAKDHK